jgi:heptosyltransferase I
LSAIGDVVHGMPVVASLRRAWPACRITWVIQPAAHPLVAGHPDVSDFVVFDRSRGARGLLDFRRAVAGRRFDLVLALQVYLKAGLLTWMLPSPRKLGFDRRRARDMNWLFTTERIPPHAPQHVQDQYFEFLEHLGVPAVRRWDFAFSEEERAAQREFFGRLERPALAVILRTTREAKNWPVERYARVLEAAESELGLQPLLVGGEGPAERAAAEEVMRLTRAGPVNALRNDLRRLAWLLDGSALALSPDTGPLHVAVALGTPTIGLYGATDPKRVGPYRRFGDLVIDRHARPGGMERIAAGDVLEKLELALRRYRQEPARGIRGPP